MRRLIPLLLAPLMLLAAFAASATTVTLNWTMPTENTDGTAIPSTDVLVTNIYAGGSAAETEVASAVTGATWTSGQEPANTKVCFYITATNSTEGTTSAPTNEVCAQIPAETPNAPTNLVIKIN